MDIGGTTTEIHFGSPSMQGIQFDDLVEDHHIEPEEFEKNWQALEVGATLTRLINVNVVSGEITEKSIEDLFKYYRIYSIASGQEDKSLKFYLFSRYVFFIIIYFQNPKNNNVFIELEINLRPKMHLILIIKSINEDLAVFISRYVEDFLKQSGIL